MKILCIDYGLKRIGLATSDPTQMIASPLITLQNKGDANNISAVRNIIVEQRIGVLLCGIAQDIDGNDTPMSVRTREFGEKLRESTGLNVVYHNERYSSKEAEDHIKNNLGITRPEKIRELVDKIAATMILSSYLESKERKGKK